MIKTKRLVLRHWREEDLEPFAKLNADPRVREYFPALLNREESDASAKLMEESIQVNGFGFFAAMLTDTQEFIGMIGLHKVLFKAPFNQLAPAVEIGWRLAFNYWGRGYATEGALASLEYGYENMGLNEIVSLTAVTNQRSRHVMEKIGMHHFPEDDFEHPNVPEGHLLRKHVLYRLQKSEWESKFKR